MNAWVFGGMLVLCGSLAACSSSETGGEGGGGTGGDASGGSDGQGGDDTVVGTGTTTTGSPTSTTTTTTTGGNTCTVGDFFDPATAAECNTCLNASCCDQAEACLADFEAGGEDCILQDGSGSFNQEGALTDALFTCLETNCTEECGGGGGVCGTDLGTEDPDLNACIDENCCTEFGTCFGETGENLEACNACLEAGGGPECDDYIACLETNCAPTTICDTPIGFNDAEVDACLSEACCDEYTACIGDGSEAAVDACLECLNSEAGGPLCDSAITCTNDSGCVPEQ